ncbi:MAG: hypothetical protein VX642_09160 [Bdellovibrionota bacterium]|nr:hypothetical protein [Bdellovibrionota bacterium]
MSKKEQAQNQGAPAQNASAGKKAAQQGSNVISINFNQCLYSECGSKPKRANFCNEHYEWFKFGLVTKNGEKAKDFDKKMMSYENFQKKKAA